MNKYIYPKLVFSSVSASGKSPTVSDVQNNYYKMFLKLGIGCFPLCISIGNRHIRTSIHINTADCYLAVDGYLVGEINKQLSSKAGVDDEGARGLQGEKD